MDGKGENTVQKPRRAAAGHDFTWPKGFGVERNGNLEHELKEAELAAAADAENDDTNRSVFPKVSKIDKHSLVADWIENVNVFKPVTDNHPQIVPSVGQPRDDINFLCQTISDVVNKVASSGNNKLLARYIVDKLTFDGNPLFYLKSTNVSNMRNFDKVAEVFERRGKVSCGRNVINFKNCLPDIGNITNAVWESRSCDLGHDHQNKSYPTVT
ncbi:hypothetical protein JTB14_006981 [Gonioctena quinquepunctata]|nr:hypothetical protein JTB14_006981 [Gonioctena quinquepunctata]